MDQKAMEAIREVIRQEFEKLETSVKRVKALSSHLLDLRKEK